MDHSPCFQQCPLHFAHYTQEENCSVLQLSRFRHRGDDPILTLSEHLLHTAFCLLHISLFAQGSEEYAVYCRCQNCSIDWDGSPFTDFTFHVIDCFSISSLQCGCGLLRRLTLIWVIFRLSRVSRNPRIHRSTNLPIHRSTNPRVNRPTWVCLPLHTVCCRPHFAHCTRTHWKKLALCTALPVLGVLWYGSLLHSVDR